MIVFEGERGVRAEVVEPVANVARALEDLRRNKRESGFRSGHN